MSTTTFSVTGAASNPYLRSDGTYFDIIVGTPGGGVSITASPGAILNGIRNGAAPATFTYYGIGSGSPTSYWTLDSSGQLAVEYKGPSATPTPTASPTPSPTPTATATPTPSPTPSPTPTGSSSATPTPSPTGTIAGLAPAAYYSYVTPVPTTLPSAMPTNPAYVQAFYGELQPYPLVTPNPFATTLTMTNPGSGADVYCELYPRNDGGATGYIDACVNSSTTTTETVAFHANQVVTYDSWDTQSNIDDSASGFCPSFTPLTYDDESFHNCAIVITEGANATFTLSGANAMKPGAVRFFRLFNGTASSAASPTPVPVITPTASPTPVPVSFPGDFPTAYDQYVNALIAPVPTTTYYPFATTPTFHIGSTPANYESFQYTTSAGAVLLVPYFPQPSATPASFSINVTSTTPGTSMYLMSVTAFLPAPTASPCQYGQGLNLASSPSPTSTGSQTAYGMCAPAVLQIEAGPPTPNPSPTYSPYPGATASGCPTNIISAVGGPFPPWSRQCYFNQNIMNGILPANATPDPNDSPYMANSGVGNGPAPLTAVGTIFGSQASGYAINYVTNGSPSVPVNLSCTPGPCGTMSTSPIWLPTDFQMQGAPDCHTELAYPSLGYVEDMWQVNKYRTPICTSPVYQGAPFSSVTAARISMNSDGAHSTGATASTISPGIGTIKPWDVLDPRVSTFPTAIQIAPPCTNHFSRPPSWGSDAGVGSTCSGVLPPTGTFVYYKWSGASTNPAQGTIDTLNHILSCNLDILSQKYWMSMVPGWGHGLIITDTNGGGSTQFYVQSETDRDLTRFGVASAWQLVAKDMGISMNSNGTYSLPISYGTGGCIASSDVHFLSPNTPPITGAAAGIAVAP